MRIISGLVKPDAGAIRWYGKQLEFPYFNIRRNCGVMTESPALFPYLNATENVQISARYLGVDLSYSEIGNMLHEVGLTEKRKDPVAKYSQGMKRRLGIAIALLNKPELLILDEPFNGLDPLGIKLLRTLITHRAKRENVAILLSSHQLNEIEFLCDRIAVIKKGKIVKEGSLLEIHQGAACMHTLECSDISKAATLLSAYRPRQVNEGQLSLWLTREEAPEAVKRMVAAHIAIYRLTPEHRLENLFEKAET